MSTYKIDFKDKQQSRAYDLIANTNTSFFLTGRAGAGKTTFMNNVQELVTHKQFITLATTGVAACLSGGCTINSFFGIKPSDICGPEHHGNMSQKNILVLLYVDTIFIDEVSMLRCDVLDTIDCTMRFYLRNNQPFGGKQLVFVGDMFQLAPVVKSSENDYLNSLYGNSKGFFFYSKVYQRIPDVRIEFTKVYRQNDSEFLQTLENIRLNRMDSRDVNRINARCDAPCKEDGLVITLSSRNESADAINAERLAEINSPEFVYTATIEGEFNEKDTLVPKNLSLKVGAQVMFLRNDPSYRWCNGTLAEVTKLSDEEVVVKLDNGNEHSVQKCTWESIKTEYDQDSKKLTRTVTGSFTQYPFKLAWAITIHKSQGQTFDKMALDLSRPLFGSGQLYVALSRVRSLSGLYINKPINSRMANTSREILEFAEGFNDSSCIDSAIECGKMVFEAQNTNDYDEIARQYLLLIRKNAINCNFREAIRLTDNFFQTVVCDESLYGIIEEVPAELYARDTFEHTLMIALMSLYARDYSGALDYANKALSKNDSREALYIKSRALEKLKLYHEADAVNCILCDTINMETPDAKVLYSTAMLNEMHIGDPGLAIMQFLVIKRPNYLKGISALRNLMKFHDIKLEGNPSDPTLVELFNSNAEETEFLSKLIEAKQKKSVSVSSLMECINKLSFDSLAAAA